MKDCFYNFKLRNSELMLNITIKQMNMFVATIEEGTILAAAARLNISSSAISMQLQNLEDSSGLVLLDRREEKYFVTEAGQEILEASYKSIDAIRICTNALETLKNYNKGRVSIGIVSTAKYFAPFLINEFKKNYKNVNVSLFVGNREEIINSLKYNKFDLAIMGRPPKELPINFTIIGDHPHVIIAHPKHPLVNRKNILPEELINEVLLEREKGSGTRLLIEHYFNKVAHSHKNFMEIGSNETIKQAVMAELGIAFISAHTVIQEIKDKRLVILDCVDMPIIRNWHVVRRSDRRFLPAQQALITFLEKQGKVFLNNFI